MSEQIELEKDLEEISRTLKRRLREEEVQKVVEFLRWLSQKYDALLGIGGASSNYIYVANVLLSIETALDAQAIRCVAKRLGLSVSLAPWPTVVDGRIPVDVYLVA